MNILTLANQSCTFATMFQSVMYAIISHFIHSLDLIVLECFNYVIFEGVALPQNEQESLTFSKWCYFGLWWRHVIVHLVPDKLFIILQVQKMCWVHYMIVGTIM